MSELPKKRKPSHAKVRLTEKTLKPASVSKAEQILAAATRQLSRDEIDSLEFVREGGGWVASKSKRSDSLSNWKKMYDRKMTQKINQERSVKLLENQKLATVATTEADQVKDSKSNLRKSSAVLPSDLSDNSDDEEDSLSADDFDAEELFTQRPKVTDPFGSPPHRQTNQIHTMWKSPDHNANRPTMITFERPSNERLTSFNSPTAIVKRLQEVISDREKQISTLQKQLMKIHAESAVLAEQVSRNKGPERHILERNNQILRDQLDRSLKENTILRGQQKQSENTVLKRIKQREELDNFHLQLMTNRSKSRSSSRMSHSTALTYRKHMSEPPPTCPPSRATARSQTVTFTPVRSR